jgi:hypothetical protein
MDGRLGRREPVAQPATSEDKELPHFADLTFGYGGSSHVAGGGGPYQPSRAGVLLSSSVVVNGSRSLLSFREHLFVGNWVNRGNEASLYSTLSRLKLFSAICQKYCK